MPEITVVLTFDDGPHSDPLDHGNTTKKVLDVLATPTSRIPIAAAFFVQTQVAERMAHPNGRAVVKRAHEHGDVIGIHTGSVMDHVCHKRRLAAPPDLPGTANGLDSDMVRAKASIDALTGTVPKYVRASPSRHGLVFSTCPE